MEATFRQYWFGDSMHHSKENPTWRKLALVQGDEKTHQIGGSKNRVENKHSRLILNNTWQLRCRLTRYEI